MTFELLKLQVALSAIQDFGNNNLYSILNDSQNTQELIELIVLNMGLNEQEAINYIIQCI